MPDIFTYGSLMCEDIMHRVAACRLTATPASLSGYRRSRLHGLEYPAIFPAQGGEVSGILYLGLNPEALQRLDIFEGELYSREELVVTAGGKPLPAMAYVLKRPYHHLLSGQEWHLAEFLQGGKARFEAAYFGFASLEGENPAG
jgi:gamma-glutamylcyclotransferase (GGCT)/AIG2-like uncharacterized protein YtfP